MKLYLCIKHNEKFLIGAKNSFNALEEAETWAARVVQEVTIKDNIDELLI